MTRNFWENFWEDKASFGGDFQATGRSKMDIGDFLYTSCEVAQKLKIQKEDVLLDVGAGAGLLSLSYSSFVEKIYCSDFSSQMVKRAKHNLRGIKNVEVFQANILNLPIDDESITKVLGYSVLQYLENAVLLQDGLTEIHRVMKPGAVALFAANPDPDKKDILREEILKKDDASMKSVELDIIDRTYYLKRNEMLELAEKIGFQVEFLEIGHRIWQSFYMYDVKLTKV